MFVDDNDAVYVADGANQRVVKWMPGATDGQVVAGGNGKGNDSNQFEFVTKVVVHNNGTMFICDTYNFRVQRWFKNDNHGETILNDILCYGLAMDNEGSLYITDGSRNRVVKWPGNQVVAGGNGKGFDLNQLNDPKHIFVDRYKTVYVADNFNYRVVKWPVGATEGIIVAGSNEQGAAKNQLSSPQSVVVDESDTVYVLDYGNDRVTRWFKNSKSGFTILGRPGWSDSDDDTSYIQRATDLVFDRHGNLFVVDNMNDRILKFPIDKNACPTRKL
jgi:sugar lactone lactonase YvrE